MPKLFLYWNFNTIYKNRFQQIWLQLLFYSNQIRFEDSLDVVLHSYLSLMFRTVKRLICYLIPQLYPIFLKLYFILFAHLEGILFHFKYRKRQSVEKWVHERNNRHRQFLLAYYLNENKVNFGHSLRPDFQLIFILIVLCCVWSVEKW